jgi:intracellular sulfur oxidation DsrE/DsrF family protein
MKNLAKILFILFEMVLFAQPGFSTETENNAHALTGVKEIKTYFDVTLGEPTKLLTQLDIIETTYNQLAASGYAPRFVVGIRGKASNLFTKEGGDDQASDVLVKKKIASKIEKFKAKGFRIEQCRIAADMQEIPVADFLPPLVVVDNGYISMIGYQSQGYALVPIY